MEDEGEGVVRVSRGRRCGEGEEEGVEDEGEGVVRVRMRERVWRVRRGCEG